MSACTGATPGPLQPIAPGLGHRQFFRVPMPDAAPHEPRSLVLRVDPPDARVSVGGVAPEPDLEPIRALLESAGIRVPRSYGHDAALGLDLLEDVGDETLESALRDATPGLRSSHYRAAIDIVARLQRIAARSGPDGRPAAFDRRLDRALIATKARKVIEWLLPEALGRAATVAERNVVERAFDAIADLVEAAPARLAHRDYKAANIHIDPAARDGAAGDAGLVLIDLQGAFMAPPEYDLVCLLRDSHVPLAAIECDALLDWAIPRLPDPPDAATARLRFDALTLSRVGKDLAHYVDAARSRGDNRYLRFVATGLERLRAAAARLRTHDPSWREIADLIEQLPLPARCGRAAAGGDASRCAR